MTRHLYLSFRVSIRTLLTSCFLFLILGSAQTHVLADPRMRKLCIEAGGTFLKRDSTKLCVCPPVSDHFKAGKIGGRRILADHINKLRKPSAHVVTAQPGSPLRCPASLLDELEAECASPKVLCHVEPVAQKVPASDSPCLDKSNAFASVVAAAQLELEVSKTVVNRSQANSNARELLEKIMGAERVTPIKIAEIYEKEDENHSYDYDKNRLVRRKDGEGVARLRGAALGPHQVIFENGKLKHCTAGTPPKCEGGTLEPFSTANSSIVVQGRSKPGITGIYVLTEKGLFISTHQEVGKFHHSSLSNGGEVLGAGEITVNANGEVEGINNRSGHYLPGRLQLKQTLLYLRAMGVNVAKGHVKLDELYPDGEEIRIDTLEKQPETQREVLLVTNRELQKRRTQSERIVANPPPRKDSKVGSAPDIRDTGNKPSPPNRNQKPVDLGYGNTPPNSGYNTPPAPYGTQLQNGSIQAYTPPSNKETAAPSAVGYQDLTTLSYGSNPTATSYASTRAPAGIKKVLTLDGLRPGFPAKAINGNYFVIPTNLGGRIEPVKLEKLDVLRGLEGYSARGKAFKHILPTLIIRGIPVKDAATPGFIKSACKTYQNEKAPKNAGADFISTQQKFNKVCDELEASKEN